MAVTNMKKMMARFSMKSVFLVLLLLFFVYLLSTYFMRGWYEGMATEKDAKKADATDAKAPEKDTKTVVADATEADAKKAAPVESKSKTETKATEK